MTALTYGVRADLACMWCSRVSATVTQTTDPPASTISSIRPEHAATVNRYVCPHCGGRLWVQDAMAVVVARRPLTREELCPRRGRRPSFGRQMGVS